MSAGFKEIDKKTLKKLHDVEIEILDEIDRICKKNNIEYFLVGGTLLGAVRHKGFIPWDDDLDIAMVREDYNKFIKVCNKDLDKKYYLDSPELNKDTHIIFSKVRKNNTTFAEAALDGIDCHKGIYVDIFPLDIESSNFKKCHLKAFFIKNMVETVFLKKNIYTIKDCRHPFFARLFSIFSVNSLLNMERFIATSYKGKKGKKGDKIISYYSAYSVKKDYFDYDVFFPTKEIVFEGKKYPCLNDNDKYLSSMYGDYMKLPPVEDRVNHSALEISFDRGMDSNKE